VPPLSNDGLRERILVHSVSPLIKGFLCIICIFWDEYIFCEQLIEETKEDRFIYLRETDVLRLCMTIIIRVLIDNGEDVRIMN
jgi:hypothetical protein